MQFSYPLLLTLAATIISAAPVAQSWQESVDQALAEANSAITSGIADAESGIQSGIDSANAAIANAGLGKRQVDADLAAKHAFVIREANPVIDYKRQSWQEAVEQALAEAYAAIQSGIQDAQAGIQSGIDAANAAINKRQSWQDSVNTALAQADAAIAQAQADAEAGIDDALVAVERARQTAADALAKYGS